MREILFRAKSKDTGKWVYGNYVPVCFGKFPCTPAIVPISDGAWEQFEIIPESLSQAIGMTDKNGEEIFDGDVCRFREWDNGDMCWVGHIYLEHCQYVIVGGANKECPTLFYIPLSRISSENIEKIGNIYDNPEFLKGDTNERDKTV